MNPARTIAAGLIALVVLGIVLYQVVGSNSCASSETALDMLAVLEQNGRINYLPGDWVGQTAEPQFAKAELIGATPETGSEYRCAGTVSIDYNPVYIKLLLAEKNRVPTGSEPLHREFRIEFTPSPAGEAQDVRLHYRLTPR